MRFDDTIFSHKAELKDYAFPEYDVAAMREMTKKAPQWAHFGPGNIFRAHIARAHQELLNTGEFKTGIIAFAAAGSETISKVYTPHDDLSIGVTLKTSGSLEKTIIASVAEAYTLEGEGLTRATEVFESPSMMLASFTITEKGYSEASYAADLGKPLDQCGTMLGQITFLLKKRMLACGKPVALVSMDNCSANGDKIKAAVTAIAKAAGEEALLGYIADNVSFPWTMIDKITPRPDAKVLEMLKKDGFEDIDPVVTKRGTYISPFVNAEEKEYLVIEDDFPNGRPPLEKAGMFFTTRERVALTEKMKVTVCLNPLHTSLAVFGCLLGYRTIWEETHDELLSKLIKKLGYDEGLPVAADPVIFKPRAFIDEVVSVRLPNPFLPDTPQRIATDTSHKLSVRFGETIKSWCAKPEGTTGLVAIPLTLAGYLRYLDAVDDEGEPFTLSDDPRMDYLRSHTKEEILANTDIFGCDLKKAGLYDRILALYAEMASEKGAVRATLKKYL